MGKQTVSVNYGESGTDNDNYIENEDTSDEEEEEEEEEELNEEDPDEDEPHEVDPCEEADEDSCGPNEENLCDKEIDEVASCEEEPNEEDSCEEEPNEADSCGSPSDSACSKEKSDQLSEEDEQSEEEMVEEEPDREKHCEEEPIQEELDEEEIEEPSKEEPEEEPEEQEEEQEEVEQCEEEPLEEEPEEDEQCEEEALEEEPSEEEPDEEELSDDPEEPCERFPANQSPNKNKNPAQSKSGKMNTSSDIEARSKRVSKTSSIQNSSNNVTARARMSATMSSGKKRSSKWDVKDEANELPEDGATKKRKTRWSRWANDDSQVNMTTPLQHPNVEIDIEIPKLQAQLFDIARKLQTGGVDHRPPSERSPSPPPIYNNLGIQINTREARIRSKLMIQRQTVISELIRKSPNFKPPPDYKSWKISKKLYVPSKEYPEYNFVGIILGPCGNTLKRMEKETGARIYLRGRGSQLEGKPQQYNVDTDDLHVLIEAENKFSLDTAVAMVEKLLIPVEEGKNELKRNQLRELAEMRGTRGNNLNFKKPDPCNICGEMSHATSACPLTAPGPGVNSNGQHVNFLVSDPPLPIPAPPPIASSASVLSKPKKEIDDANLYVGCLPQSVDDNALIELFCRFGALSQAKVVRDRITNISKGYGFVKYTDHNNAAKAVAHMHGYKINGKMLIVRIAGILPPPVQTKQLPTYPSPAVIAQNSPYPMSWVSLTKSQNIPYPMSWPGPSESQNNLYPMSWPGPSESQNNLYPMSWPGPPESRLQGTVPSFSNSSPFSGLSSVSLGPLCQTPMQSSLFSSDFGTSNELAQFPGYIKSFDFESTPASSHSHSLVKFSQDFGGYQMPPT